MRGTEMRVYGVDIGQDEQRFRLELATQHRRHAILIHHGVESFDSELRIVVHRGAPAAAGHHNVTPAHEVGDHLPFHHAHRLGTRYETPPPSGPVLPHGL